ncbi:TaqI-like C-terminal specificity domain-containing protein [uncultured Gimesia sp.]|uniref:TaqI-like C-terminal specificity domain-containing protein n=1 Tax=uncultured Gimesia sp. TaxID=1678688 RepID=UPI002619B2FD|nr:TaqI-like C-terminal specificity domain-containing protein [uncultured Gimesia sp.]
MRPQLRLKDLNEPHLPIKDAAQLLGVSTASIRNWIKTGYLTQTDTGFISKESFESFKNEVAGQEKLTARANKSLKDTHDHRELQTRFHELVQDSEHNAAELGGLYEAALSNAYRNKEGIYYTHPAIAERFFQYLPRAHAGDRSDLTFCDPCCGSGNFLLAAIEQGIDPAHIYGFDTDPIAVAMARKRIFEKTGYDSPNIHFADFLEQSLQPEQSSFDVIFTNPPWGKKISKAEKQKYASHFGAGKCSDTSALFFFACLPRLNQSGSLGFLLPDAFFNVASFEDARQAALTRDIKAFMDFGKSFQGLLTKAKGIVLQNQEPGENTNIVCEGLDQRRLRTQDSFRQNPKSIFNFTCSQEAAAVIEHLYEREHLTLVDRATYGLGIVTGNNKKFCRASSQAGYMPVYKGSDIHEEKLNEPSAFIPDDLSLYQQVAPVELFQANEKLIYRFISSDLVFYHDTEQTFFLNSVNMLVLHDDFQISAKQLSQILNSNVMNWLFRSLFETHKVLRSDIEALPIHTQYFEKHTEFDEEAFLNYLGLEQTADGSYKLKV